MNVNYQKKLDDIINKIETNLETPTLLLHSCCAPCSTYVIKYLSNYFKITVLYYNPNITIDLEYEKRKNEQEEFIKKINSTLKNEVYFLEGEYNSKDFFNAIKGYENYGEGSIRCDKCFELRLDYTGKICKEKNLDYFTTTLSISPLKNSNKLNEIGEIIEKKYNKKYLYSDFKKKDGYKNSTIISKLYNLYRQNYCACIFSKIESEKRGGNSE